VFATSWSLRAETCFPVALEAATIGMTLAEFGTGFAHPDDTGYQRYTSAFWSAMEARL